MRKTASSMLAMIITSLIITLPVNVAIGSPNGSVHVLPQYIDVGIAQTPYTEVVAIVARFNETGIRMDLVNASLDIYGNYTININITRLSLTVGSSNKSVFTTLGTPHVGKHGLLVKEVSLGTLAERVFNVVAADVIFSKNGLVASLKTYMNYTRAEIKSVSPGLCNYTRFMVNSTSPSALIPGITMGIRINNTLTTTLSNVNLSLSPPIGINLNVFPRNLTYGTLSPSSSKIGYFNITTKDIQAGCYNITYTLKYTNTSGVQTIADVIPIGVCLAKATWIAINQTAIVTTTTPFNDTDTTRFYNYTTVKTVENETLLQWQNSNASSTFSNFTGSLHSPFWGQLVLGAVVGIVAEGARQYFAGEPVNVGKLAVAGALGAVTAVIPETLLEAGFDIITGVAESLGEALPVAAKVAEVASTINDVTDAAFKIETGVVDGITMSQDENKAVALDTEDNLQSYSVEEGEGIIDPSPSTSTGTTVIPPPTQPPSPGVGGIAIPVDKLGLLASYIGLASTMIVATVATAIYVKRIKGRKEKQ